jgi:hypothetical protein
VRSVANRWRTGLHGPEAEVMRPVIAHGIQSPLKPLRGWFRPLGSCGGYSKVEPRGQC